MSNDRKKVAFVTGGSRGIGAAIVERLVSDGFHVTFSYVNGQEKASDLERALLQRGASVKAIKCDSSVAEELESAINATAEKFGGIDVLVSNAGIGRFDPIWDLTLEDFDRTVAVNIRPIFVATKAVVNHMPKGGRIITIGSCNAERMPWPNGSIYAMSKAAVAMMGSALARDLAQRGITINTVQPGPIDTDLNPAKGPQAATQHGVMALDEHGTGHDIADMVSYLARPESRFVTGAKLTIDGGFNC